MTPTPVQASHSNDHRPHPERLLCIWLSKNALMLQVSPFLPLCRNTKSTFCLLNNVWDIYLSLDGHQAHIPPLVTPEVTALSNGQLWLLPISLFAHLLTHGVNICKTKRTAEEKKKKGVLFDLGSRCVGPGCLCVCGSMCALYKTGHWIPSKLSMGSQFSLRCEVAWARIGL